MECSMIFEDYIEKIVLEDALEFYTKGEVPIDSVMWCRGVAWQCDRDPEEAQLLYACLFPYAYKYVGEIENIKRNAI